MEKRVRVWKIGSWPGIGKKTSKWKKIYLKEAVENRFAAIGFTVLKDLRKYGDIREKFIESVGLYPTSAETALYLRKEIKPGDVILQYFNFSNGGIGSVNVGIVKDRPGNDSPYYFVPENSNENYFTKKYGSEKNYDSEDYAPHRIDVEWWKNKDDSAKEFKIDFVSDNPKFQPAIVEFTDRDFHLWHKIGLNRYRQGSSREMDEELKKVLKNIFAAEKSGTSVSPSYESLDKQEEEEAEKRIEKESDSENEEALNRYADRKPEMTKGTSSRPKRDPEFSARMKKKYKKCQVGDESFRKADGKYYVETHHLIPLGAGGLEGRSNVVVLCPMCHRKLHHGSKEVRLEALESLKNWPDTAEIVKKLISESH